MNDLGYKPGLLCLLRLLLQMLASNTRLVDSDDMAETAQQLEIDTLHNIYVVE